MFLCPCWPWMERWASSAAIAEQTGQPRMETQRLVPPNLCSPFLTLANGASPSNISKL